MSETILAEMIDDFVGAFDSAKSILANELESAGEDLRSNKETLAAATNSVVGALVSFRVSGKASHELPSHLLRALPTNFVAILGGQRATAQLAERLNRDLQYKLNRFSRDQVTWAFSSAANATMNLDKVSNRKGLEHFANSAALMNPIGMLPGYAIDLLASSFSAASRILR